MLLLLKNLLFTVFIPGTVAVFVPLLLFSHAPVAVAASSAGAVLLLLAGGCVYLWCLWDFASFGRGTPLPLDPPKHLVIRGLYRYSRNPMYIGVLTVIFGWSLLFQSLALVVYGCAVAACFHLMVVFYEEPHLKRVFGTSYEQYCTQVGRWVSWRRHTTV